ncbi:hypothetical protein KZX45_07645 [Georgenia sp. EYE_87]|uniref:hypothetical protein n=1 Tax=Georgenia sp. EYE_87 TaxID=2853448 RepID=UPI002003EEEF|nr:hypothetical protein [Georgenia sp. EYE_87]MCK6210412.1 hypothetical protein [Georgenia sp. EYE_87]
MSAMRGWRRPAAPARAPRLLHRAAVITAVVLGTGIFAAVNTIWLDWPRKPTTLQEKMR